MCTPKSDGRYAYACADSFPDPKFYEAQALVLSNMGQHKQALEIYVFKLEEFDKAEEYA